MNKPIEVNTVEDAIAIFGGPIEVNKLAITSLGVVNTTASGSYSTSNSAFGYKNTASGSYSTAFGFKNTASGYQYVNQFPAAELPVEKIVKKKFWRDIDDPWEPSAQ